MASRQGRTWAPNETRVWVWVFNFLSIWVVGLGLGILQIFCKFRNRLFKILKKILIFGYGILGKENQN